MPRFERVKLDLAEWGKTLSTFEDAIVYQSPAYLSFLAETQNGELVLAALKEGDEILGYFTGMIVRRFGLKILGSPFRMWTCPYMGFVLRPSVPRRVAVEALGDFAFKELGCIHFEIVDSHMTEADVAGLPVHHELNRTYRIDLTQTEEALFANMNSFRRRDIRRAEKNGVVVEEANDPGFADDYATHLAEVFAKKNMVPTFGVNRVRVLIKHLQPTGMLLTLRARNPEGRCIATGIYAGMQRYAFYWGGASLREFQKLNPNELLQWYAIKYWKNRGVKLYNLVGTMDFKARFGGEPWAIPLICKSKYRVIAKLRTSAPQAVNTALKLAWKIKSIGRKTSPPAAKIPAGDE